MEFELMDMFADIIRFIPASRLDMMLDGVESEHS
jgi:hypothetical protein